MNTEYIEPTLRGRITLAIFYLAIAIWYVTYHVYIDPMLQYIKELSGCEMIFWVRKEVIYFASVLSVAGIVTFIKAIQLFKYKQFPIPSAYVFKKTKIEYGNKVKIEAIKCILFSFLIFSALGYAYIYLNIPLIFNEECLTN